MGGFFDDVLGFDDSGGIGGTVKKWGGEIDDAIFQPITGAIQDGLQWIFGVSMPEIPDYSRERDIMVTRGSNIAKLPVIYGERRVGGVRVYQSVSGANNEYLWQVVALCEGPVDSIGDVYLDDVISTDAQFGSAVQITKYTGTPFQAADAGLTAAFPGVWTSAHKLSGVAYLVVRLTYDPNIFSRAPTISAVVKGRTVYDPRENLLSWSEEVSSGWSGSGLNAVDSNVTDAPDGQSTADMLVESTANTLHRITRAGIIANEQGPVCFSAYVKDAGRPRGTLFIYTSDNAKYVYVVYDLTNGTIYTSGSYGGATLLNYGIEPAGDGWYRVWVASTVNGTGNAVNLQLRMRDAAFQETYTGDGTSGVYVWGTQLVNGSQPRGYCKTLGSKQIQTWENRIPDSEVFDSGWTWQGASVSADTAAGPDNSATGDRLVENTSNSLHRLYRTIGNINTSHPLCFSMHFKEPTGRRKGVIFIHDGTGANYIAATFDLVTKTIYSTSQLNATILSYGIEPAGWDWYRVWVAGIVNGSGGVIVQYRMMDDSYNQTYTGDGTSGCNLWGAMLNSGAEPMPYTKTSGAAVFGSYTTNPARCMLDYLTSRIYGKGLAPSMLDLGSFAEAAGLCDRPIQINQGGGSTMLQFECNGALDTSQPLRDNAQELLTTCRGQLPYVGGRYKLVIDDDRPARFSFTTANIIGAWSVQYGSKRVRLNSVKARFCNPAKNWDSDLAITDSGALRTLDSGLLLEKELQFPFETNYYRALYHSEVALKRSRQGLIVSFVAAPEALACEIGDIVDVTHASPGWSAKLFRVTGVSLRADGLVGMTLQEHEPTAYDRTVPVEAATPPDTNLPNPRIVADVAGLTLASGTDELILGTDGTIVSRIKVSWTASTDIYVIGYEVEYKLTTDATWTMAARTNSKTHNAVHIAPVKDGAQYDVRVRAANAAGFFSAYTQQLNYTAIGKSEPPAAPTQFLISRDADGTRRFTWLPPSPLPLDIDGYQIRYKAGTGHTWASMTALHQGVIAYSPYETNQLAAGTYTFAIATVDTTGNVSSAVYIEATIGDPRLSGALDIVTPHLQNWPGTLTNCFKDATSGWLVATDQDTWTTLSGTQWQNWQSWTGNARTLTYEHTQIDIGVITKFTPLLSAEYIGTATLEINTSQNGTTWSGWAAPAGEVNARYIKIRATIVPPGVDQVCALQSMTLILDANVVSEDIEDLATSTLTGSYRIGTGDIRLPIAKSYGVIKKIDVSLQNVGAGWSWEVIDKNTSPGPRIKIYNASNTLADATIDATVRGI